MSAGGASDCDDDGTTTALAADPKKAIAQRYALDYSRWQEWTPDDPATLQEREEVERAENDKKNAEFERNNPDFCNQYKEDIENRTKAVKKKAETAESARLKGNNLFKKKMLEEALNMYIESLKLLPYDVKTLTNIAQVHIQRKEWDDALEFLKRSLHMDKNLVKALSRKAFVLGETGQPRDALAALARALELEPRNEDLLSQKRELDVVVMELTAEERLAESLSAEEAGVEAMDALCAALEAITPSVAAGGEAAAAGCIVDEAIVSRALRAEKGSESVRIYVRTSGCLQATLTYLSAVGDACTDPALLDRLETLLLLLADAVDKQRAPKMLMIERKALKTIKTFLGYPSSHAGLMNGCLRLLDRTSCDDTCTKARDLVLTDRELLTRISIVVGELSAAEGDASRDASRDDAIFMSGASVLRYAAFADSAKTVLTAGVGIGVCAIAAVIEKSADSTSQPSESFCMAVEALLGLSQAAPLRPFFAAPLPRREAQQKDVSAAVTATSVVIRVGRSRPALLATCLAVLMNASLENEPVRSEILLHGGLADTLAVLKYTDKQRADCHDDYILSRSAGVLSRIATAPEAQQQLLQQDTYSLVCRCLKRACAKAEPRQRWEDDETGHLVRLLASITPDKPCRDAGVAEGVLTSILSIFPEPRRELHEITPTSVTLVPERIAGTVILGNAARCLMVTLPSPLT